MSTQKSKDLRRLLSATKQQRQQQQEASSSSLKVTHPLAKYDTNNKLTCVICSVIIKGESLWHSHLASLSHKETLRKLKEVKEKVSKASSGSTSGSSGSIVNEVTSLTPIKSPTSPFKPKSILKKESSFNNLEQELTITNNKKRSVGVEGKITNISINASPNYSTDEVENDFEEEEEEKVMKQARVKRVKYSDDSLTTEHIIDPIPQSSTIPSDSQMSVDTADEEDTTSKLPPDFFDTETAASVATTNQNSYTQEREIAQQESALPADFFDNSSSKYSSTKTSTSEIDEQEWINFQKEISKETQVSNQISNADDEQLQKDRDEMQEREQEFCLARLERLKNVVNRVKENRDKLMTVDNNNMIIKDDEENIDDTDDDIDDEFIDGWMDWRAQKIIMLYPLTTVATGYNEPVYTENLLY